MSMVTVAELIARLSECIPAAEVRIASQPSWPLQHTLMGVATVEDIAGETACERHELYNCDECREENPDIVYLVEGNAPDQPYAPWAAWECAR